jgi:hypothetical protein
MKIVYGLLIATLCLPPWTAAAPRMEGATLLKFCRATTTVTLESGIPLDQAMDVSACTGYLDGVLDMHEVAVEVQGLERMFCVPDSVTLKEVARVVVEYIEGPHDPVLQSGYALTVAALSAAYPCQR